MKFTSILFLAAAAVVAANEEAFTSTDSTTTLTSTTTKTMTITQCSEGVANCPYAKPTTTPIYTAGNTTVVAPSSGFTNATSTSPVDLTSTTATVVVGPTGGDSAPVESEVPESGASLNLVGPGMLVAALAGGAALL